MHGIGAGQQFQRGAHADAVIVGFDRGRADEEAVAGARHDIKRPARMHQTDRARQRDLRRFDDDDLALDAAQIGAGIVARGDAAAIDHHAVEIVRRRRRLEFDRHTGGAQRVVQGGQNLARIDMALSLEVQAVREAPGQHGLELGKFIGVDVPVRAGQPVETLDIGAVARMRDHQRAVERRLRQRLAPQIERAQAEAGDQIFCGLALAIRRQHAAGPMAGGLRHRWHRCVRKALPCSPPWRTVAPATFRRCRRR